MEMMANVPNWAMLMDILALTVSGILIGWLIRNRIRYGHLMSIPRAARGNFTSEITLQAVTQQSQLSYLNIQRTLQHEFENLQRLTASDRHAWPDGDKHPGRHEHRANAPEAGPRRTDGYTRALDMLQEGVDPQDIAQRCGLARGEIDLIEYMQTQHG